MVYINEWFPNPTGPDASSEFVELYNSGVQTAGLGGWTLAAESKKRFVFGGGSIPAGGYLVLHHKDTKLSLKNTDGGLALYDAAGRIVDRGSFLGAAPEGKSYSRVNYAEEDIEHFAFTTPSPGAANKATAATLASRTYPENVPLNAPLDIGGFFAIMMGTSALLAGLIIYVAKTNEDLSKLFSERDGGYRGADGQGDPRQGI